MVKVGEDLTERLDVLPAQLRVLITVRTKYAYQFCERGVVQALVPVWLTEDGLPI